MYSHFSPHPLLTGSMATAAKDIHDALKSKLRRRAKQIQKWLVCGLRRYISPRYIGKAVNGVACLCASLYALITAPLSLALLLACCSVLEHVLHLRDT